MEKRETLLKRIAAALIVCGECKNGPVAVLRRDSAEVMVAAFGAQDAVNKIRHFAIQAFDETDMPLDQIPFRHYPG
jgi:hypothetical protein